jgi:hypothetical protein
VDVIRRFSEMKVWVARKNTVPPEIPLVLAGDLDSNVRAAVTMKNKLPKELFTVLAGDADDFVRQGIAYNKNTPVSYTSPAIARYLRDTRGSCSESYEQDC